MTALGESFTPEKPLLLLGCGKMGGALLDGWLRCGLDGRAVVILDPMPSDDLQAFAQKSGLDLRTDGTVGGSAPRAVVLAVKPQIMAEALPAVAAAAQGGALYLSIAAGTPTAFFEAQLGAGTPIVRAMPNTPAAVGAGATALYGNGACSAEDRALAAALAEAAGVAVWLDDEALMDAVTGVSGSGPAYVFHMIEALAQAGEAEGLPSDLAMTLARQTVVGAAALAGASEESPAQLRKNVTSPGGTTAAGLGVLMEAESGLPPLMTKTVAAAAKRSRELRG